MKQQDLIDKLENKLRLVVMGLKQNIEIVKKIRPGVIYETVPVFNTRILFKVKTYNDESIRISIIAAQDLITGLKTLMERERNPYNISIRIGADVLAVAKEVPPSDYPLYIGWKWITSEFEKLLKGAS